MAELIKAPGRDGKPKPETITLPNDTRERQNLAVRVRKDCTK